MPSRVQLKLSAVQDLAEAYAWYETQRLGLGEEFLAAVGHCLDSIALHPRARAIAWKDTRRALVKRFPYSVFCRVTEQEVVVRAIFHNSRHPARWQQRLRHRDD